MSEKKMGRMPTTRLFSLQLADHDNLFAPREKTRHSFRWLKLAIFLLPSFAAFIAPSYNLGRAVFRDPGVTVPDTLKQGEIFTIPANEDDDLVPTISGRPLGFVDGSKPMYVGAALKPFDFELSFDFNDGDERRRLKALIPRMKHPTYALYFKRIHVVADEVQSVETPAIAAPKTLSRREADKAYSPPTAPPFSPAEIKAFERFDGNMRLRCWRPPVVEPMGIDPLKPRKHPRLGTLTAAGPGEVVYASPTGATEMTLLVYHGGGLFTRYWGLKEIKAPKNGRINAGQTLGYVHLAPQKFVTQPTWKALMGGIGGPGEIKPQALLELSSQLCGSK